MSKLPIHTQEKTWYEEGLSFNCTGCGRCCSGPPGVVWVNPEEQQKIADFLEISLAEFQTHYGEYVGNTGQFSLHELQNETGEYDCMFLHNNKCMIYPVRPTQCRTFPWWPQNLASHEAWKKTAERCEGICPDAPVISKEEIKDNLALHRAQVPYVPHLED